MEWNEVVQDQFLLPSDSSRRTDMELLRQGEESLEAAEAEKRRLEDIQRSDKALRAKA